jgi:hypothetical protein
MDIYIEREKERKIAHEREWAVNYVCIACSPLDKTYVVRHLMAETRIGLGKTKYPNVHETNKSEQRRRVHLVCLAFSIKTCAYIAFCRGQCVQCCQMPWDQTAMIAVPTDSGLGKHSQHKQS